MGGAYKGDAFHNSFYMNSGQDERNRWIGLELIGTKTNRSAIGSRIKITVSENGKTRSIYRDVNSGGSFGASPLRKEIGIGRADVIDTLEIQWHAGSKQIFKNVKPNRFLRITEEKDVLEVMPLRALHFTKSLSHQHHASN
jgi:hypothetical protein